MSLRGHVFTIQRQGTRTRPRYFSMFARCAFPRWKNMYQQNKETTMYRRGSLASKRAQAPNVRGKQGH
jgi:hypothetical protein